MSELNVGTISVSGQIITSSGLKLTSFINSNRPAADIGTLIYNSEEEVVQLWSGTEWIDVGGSSRLDGSTIQKAAPSATAILQLNPSASNGYYWIKPLSSSQPKYVYCDMTTDGGGWMLMINARAGNGGQYYNNNAYGLSIINGNNNVVEYNKSTTSMYSRTDITEFFKISGFKYGRITPISGTTINSPYTGLYQRIGTTVDSEWGGTLFDCSNRGSLTSSTYSWCLAQYQNWSEVQSGTNSQTGTYTGANHYYPTTYANNYQNFWKGSGDGIRFSSTFRSNDYSTIGQNTTSGYFWIKTT